jgi:hypothetical protein
MSITIPATAQLARPKAMFYFYSPLQTVFQSPTVSDTTSEHNLSGARRTVKTYTLTIPTGANLIRVVIYGATASGYSMTVILIIDGVEVASTTVDTRGATALLIDYTGSITPGSHTVQVDTITLNGSITAVYIATGIGLTSTTPTTIATFTVTYQLLRQGDIRYSPGVRVFVFGNRKTTAPITLTIPEATSVTIGRNNLGAGNDNDKAETILAILTGSVVLQEGGEFTINVSIRGGVGASGDTVIITRILMRAQLRRETGLIGAVGVYERGVVEYAGRALLVSVPGGATSTSHQLILRDIQDRHLLWTLISGGGADVIFYNFRVAVIAPIHFATFLDDDNFGETFLLWVQVVVWG